MSIDHFTIVALLYIFIAVVTGVRLVLGIKKKNNGKLQNATLISVLIGSLTGSAGFFLSKSIVQVVCLDIAVILYLFALVLTIIKLKRNKNSEL